MKAMKIKFAINHDFCVTIFANILKALKIDRDFKDLAPKLQIMYLTVKNELSISAKTLKNNCFA